MLFTNWRRPTLQVERPGKYSLSSFYLLLELKITELSVEIGKEWKQMSEDQWAVSFNFKIQVWKNKAKELKFTYELQNYNYKRDHDGQAPVDEKKKAATAK